MRKILVGTDLSTEAEVAVAHAVDRARRDGAEVVLVMVDAVPELPAGVTPGSRAAARAEVYKQLLDNRLTADRRELADLRQRWLGQGAEISELVVDGFPDDRLPAVAAETGTDLIVVGSHGRTGLKRIVIGSVAERTARLAPCSVLIARGDAPTGGYRRIVVGTDFSDGAKAALRQAEAAAATGATLEVVHCCHVTLGVDPIDPMAIASTTRMYGELLDDLRAEGERWIASSRSRSDLTIAFSVVERPATAGLTETAAERSADLIVVGSHGRRGIRRFMLGSVAEATARHARCSTLIAR